jgi:hypothetical protein
MDTSLRSFVDKFFKIRLVDYFSVFPVNQCCFTVSVLTYLRNRDLTIDDCGSAVCTFLAYLRGYDATNLGASSDVVV